MGMADFSSFYWFSFPKPAVKIMVLQTNEIHYIIIISCSITGQLFDHLFLVRSSLGKGRMRGGREGFANGREGRGREDKG